MEDGKVLRFKLPDDFLYISKVAQKRILDEWILSDLLPELDCLPQDLKSFYGFDFGRSGDISCIAILTEKQNLHRQCPLVIELRNIPFKEQEFILNEITKRLPRFGGGAHDSRGNGQSLAESIQREHGKSKIQAIMLTEKWYQDNFPKYKAALEDKSLILVKDADILADHLAVKIDNGTPKIPSSYRYKGSDGFFRHGDAAIALLLSHFASCTKVYSEFYFTSTRFR